MRLCALIIFMGFAPSIALAADAGVALVADAGVAAVDAAVAAVSSDAGVVIDAGAAVVVPEISDLGGAVNALSMVVQLARTGQWMAFAILLLQLFIFVLRRFAPKEFITKWGATIVTLLSGVLALLIGVLGGSTWVEAGFVFLSGPLATVGYDTLKAVGILKSKSDSESESEDDSTSEDAAESA